MGNSLNKQEPEYVDRWCSCEAAGTVLQSPAHPVVKYWDCLATQLSEKLRERRKGSFALSSNLVKRCRGGQEGDLSCVLSCEAAGMLSREITYAIDEYEMGTTLEIGKLTGMLIHAKVNFAMLPGFFAGKLCTLAGTRRNPQTLLFISSGMFRCESCGKCQWKLVHAYLQLLLINTNHHCLLWEVAVEQNSIPQSQSCEELLLPSLRLLEYFLNLLREYCGDLNSSRGNNLCFDCIDDVQGKLSSGIQKTRVQLRKKHVLNSTKLLRFVIASSKKKVFLVSAMSIFSLLASQLQHRGMLLRQEIEQEFGQVFTSVFSSTSAQRQADAAVSKGSRSEVDDITMWKRSLLLLGLETCRSVALLFLYSARKECIYWATTREREERKRSLYTALTRMPISFYDTHTIDDIDEIVFFVNDLEGVDVAMQRFLAEFVQTTVSAFQLYYWTISIGNAELVRRMFLALSLSRLVETGAEWVKISARKMQTKCAQFEDLEELENVDYDAQQSPTVGGQSVLLRGMDIIAETRSLRPLQADCALMSWWNEYQQKHAMKLARQGVLRSVWTSFGFLPSVVSSAASCVSLVLPILVSASTGGVLSVSTISECSRCIDSLVQLNAEAGRISDLVLYNGYKIAKLDSILDGSGWEERRGGNPPSVLLQRFLSGLEKPTSGQQKPFHSVHIRFDDVSFSYPSRPDLSVLESLSFSIPLQRGKIVVISGRTGSGKSTIVSLLLRMYNIEKGGSIYLQGARDVGQSPDNGQEENLEIALESFPSNVLREQLFGFVPQCPTVFRGTIAQNVSLEQTCSITNSEQLRRVERACKVSQLDVDVSRLPEKYLTVVSQEACIGAVRLSGGQQQRLCIARAVYRGAGILLMDEPTSALDATTSKELFETLSTLLHSGKVHRHADSLHFVIPCTLKSEAKFRLFHQMTTPEQMRSVEDFLQNLNNPERQVSNMEFFESCKNEPLFATSLLQVLGNQFSGYSRDMRQGAALILKQVVVLPSIPTEAVETGLLHALCDPDEHVQVAAGSCVSSFLSTKESLGRWLGLPELLRTQLLSTGDPHRVLGAARCISIIAEDYATTLFRSAFRQFRQEIFAICTELANCSILVARYQALCAVKSMLECTGLDVVDLMNTDNSGEDPDDEEAGRNFDDDALASPQQKYEGEIRDVVGYTAPLLPQTIQMAAEGSENPEQLKTQTQVQQVCVELLTLMLGHWSLIEEVVKMLFSPLCDVIRNSNSQESLRVSCMELIAEIAQQHEDDGEELIILHAQEIFTALFEAAKLDEKTLVDICMTPDSHLPDAEENVMFLVREEDELGNEQPSNELSMGSKAFNDPTYGSSLRKTAGFCIGNLVVNFGEDIRDKFFPILSEQMSSDSWVVHEAVFWFTSETIEELYSSLSASFVHDILNLCLRGVESPYPPLRAACVRCLQQTGCGFLVACSAGVEEESVLEVDFDTSKILGILMNVAKTDRNKSVQVAALSSLSAFVVIALKDDEEEDRKDGDVFHNDDDGSDPTSNAALSYEEVAAVYRLSEGVSGFQLSVRTALYSMLSQVASVDEEYTQFLQRDVSVVGSMFDYLGHVGPKSLEVLSVMNTLCDLVSAGSRAAEPYVLQVAPYCGSIIENFLQDDESSLTIEESTIVAVDLLSSGIDALPDERGEALFANTDIILNVYRALSKKGLETNTILTRACLSLFGDYARVTQDLSATSEQLLSICVQFADTTNFQVISSAMWCLGQVVPKVPKDLLLRFAGGISNRTMAILKDARGSVYKEMKLNALYVSARLAALFLDKYEFHLQLIEEAAIQLPKVDDDTERRDLLRALAAVAQYAFAKFPRESLTSGHGVCLVKIAACVRVKSDSPEIKSTWGTIVQGAVQIFSRSVLEDKTLTKKQRINASKLFA